MLARVDRWRLLVRWGLLVRRKKRGRAGPRFKTRGPRFGGRAICGRRVGGRERSVDPYRMLIGGPALDQGRVGWGIGAGRGWAGRSRRVDILVELPYHTGASPWLRPCPWCLGGRGLVPWLRPCVGVLGGRGLVPWGHVHVPPDAVRWVGPPDRVESRFGWVLPGCGIASRPLPRLIHRRRFTVLC